MELLIISEFLLTMSPSIANKIEYSITYKKVGLNFVRLGGPPQSQTSSYSPEC